MRTYRKIALLVLNSDHTKYLVVQKVPYSSTQEWTFPGGEFDTHSELECLEDEIQEELDCDINFPTLRYVGTYEGVAAGSEHNRVWMKVYAAELFGPPRPSGEIAELHWVGVKDVNNYRLSQVNRDVVIPDLLERGILKE